MSGLNTRPGSSAARLIGCSCREVVLSICSCREVVLYRHTHAQLHVVAEVAAPWWSLSCP